MAGARRHRQEVWAHSRAPDLYAQQGRLLFRIPVPCVLLLSLRIAVSRRLKLLPPPAAPPGVLSVPPAQPRARSRFSRGSRLVAARKTFALLERLTGDLEEQ